MKEEVGLHVEGSVGDTGVWVRVVVDIQTGRRCSPQPVFEGVTFLA